MFSASYFFTGTWWHDQEWLVTEERTKTEDGAKDRIPKTRTGTGKAGAGERSLRFFPHGHAKLHCNHMYNPVFLLRVVCFAPPPDVRGLGPRTAKVVDHTRCVIALMWIAPNPSSCDCVSRVWSKNTPPPNAREKPTPQKFIWPQVSWGFVQDLARNLVGRFNGPR